MQEGALAFFKQFIYETIFCRWSSDPFLITATKPKLSCLDTSYADKLKDAVSCIAYRLLKYILSPGNDFTHNNVS
jgi:hypothetical protein